MNLSFLDQLPLGYELPQSLMAGGIVVVIQALAKFAFRLVPTFERSRRLNNEVHEAKLRKPNYVKVQRKSQAWGIFFLAVIFGLILPLSITGDGQVWWKVLLNSFIILMFYDFFYYLTHRFLFHDGGFMGGPLLWVHAVHHRQHNPCRQDSGFLHPIENGMGMGLYAASIFMLSQFLGRFDIATIVITWIAFTQINLHNHDLWDNEKFPFRYLAYMTTMHHNHHARFTGGNFATISLLYDWLFGTMDHGNGYPAMKSQSARSATEANKPA